MIMQRHHLDVVTYMFYQVCLLVIIPLLSYDLSHNISVGLFHDKKCCNCINLFPCILWDFIVLGLVLVGEDSNLIENQVDFARNS